jgi:hypothetical protein
LLADPTARFHDLGAGFYDTRINPERAKRNHVRQLEASATRSPWNPPPDRAPIDPPGPGSAALRRVLPPAHAPWIFGSALCGPAFPRSPASVRGEVMRS